MALSHSSSAYDGKISNFKETAGFLRVLMVEDDKEDFMLTQHMLRQRLGDRVRLDWEMDWTKALHRIRADEHDVYLIDNYLGANSGLELVHALNGEIQDLSPIIFITANENREDDLKAMDAGVTDYLVKGKLNAEQLERSIRYATERKNVEKRLARLAQRDILTGLANRFLFTKNLHKALEHARRVPTEICGLLLVDLNGFKAVNDTHGHPVGDLVLIEMSERLRQCFRETDTVARLGGDEFAVIANHIQHPKDAAKLAEKAIEALAAPFEADGRSITIAASVGIALYPNDSRDEDQLLKFADMALYKAKTNRAGDYRFFDTEMYLSAQVLKALEYDFRVSLRRQDFELHYQPKVDCATGAAAGAEALIRWRHDTRGLVAPDMFIGMAEENGLIIELGDWVLEQACGQAAAWRAGGVDLPVSVNVSAVQLDQPDFAQRVMKAVNAAGIPPYLLELEVSETVIRDEAGIGADHLKELTAAGVTVAIDDFGTGHSAFVYMERFPVKKVKVDRYFVEKITEDNKGACVAAAMVKLGKHLGVTVVAEGVETALQRDALIDCGCDELQGFLLCRPLPANEFDAWLADTSTATRAPNST